MKVKPEKNPGLIRTHDPVIPVQRSNQLSYQANWEWEMIWIHNTWNSRSCELQNKYLLIDKNIIGGFIFKTTFGVVFITARIFSSIK